MKNKIISHIHGLDINAVDKLLPFTSCDVEIVSITYTKTLVRQRPVLILEMDIESEKIILSMICSDRSVIDNWDQAGRLVAVYEVIKANTSTLSAFVSQEHEENKDLYHID